MNLFKCLILSAAIATVLVISIGTPTASLANETIAPPTLIKDGGGGYVLEDLVVLRRTSVGDVALENDGSFSLLRDDSSTIFSALNSGPGAAVNFDVSFAKHSIVLTADGQLTLETVARAIRLIGEQQPYTLLIKHNPKFDPSGRRGLTQSRANAILSELNKQQELSNRVSVIFGRDSSGLQEVGKSQLLQVTIMNAGSDSIAVQ